MDIFVDLIANGYILGETENSHNRHIYKNKDMKLNKYKISFNIYFPYDFRKLYKDILNFYREKYPDNLYYTGRDKLSQNNVVIVSNLEERKFPYKHITDTIAVNELIERTSDLIVLLQNQEKLILQEHEVIKLRVNYNYGKWGTRYDEIVKVIY